MPLNALWGFSATDYAAEFGWSMKVVWLLGLISFATTTVLVVTWIVKDRRAGRKKLEAEGRAVPPGPNQLATTVVIVPLVIASNSLICVVRPATCLVMEVVIAVQSSVCIGALAQYFILGLGEPPMPENLLKQLTPKRWWCGPFCGGVNAMLPGLGLIWSKTEHQLELKDMRTAFDMVGWFMLFFITSNVITLSIAMVPTTIVQRADGWCESTVILPVLSGLSTFFAISSSFLGTAGFSVIASVADMVEQTHLNKNPTNSRIHVKEKAGAANIYMSLPLLLPILMSLPLQGKQSVGIPVPITEGGQVTSNGTWSITGKTYICPVYDHETCAHLIYCVIVLVAMAYEAFFNFRYYPPGDRLSANGFTVCFSDEEEPDADETGEDGSTSSDDG